jgi:malonate-semialdehyde dehydrogenase (acetylating)/methylmalonate-semialdehyde dehydrogenase
MIVARKRSSFSSSSSCLSSANANANAYNAYPEECEWLTVSSDGIPTYKNFVGGRFVESLSSPNNDAMIDVTNPATNEVVARVPETTQEELEEAVQVAHEAFQSWRQVPVQQRQRVMLEYQALIRDETNMNALAHLITQEQGKTLPDARGDVFRGLEVVESACSTGDRLMGESLAGISSGMDCVSYRMPLGVCAGIAPFNFPAMIPLWMFPVACTAGNTFLLKPSEKTPGAAMMLAQLAQQAGLPDGVLNIVHGSKPVVDFLCDAPPIQAISFVGSNHVGEYIHARATSNGKRAQCNLGAKNHATLLPDADRTAAIKAISGAAFGAAGQRCMALSVVILVGDTQHWMADLVSDAKQLQVGSGFSDHVDIGPLITTEARDRCERIIAEAVEAGATLELDGRGTVVPGFEGGAFLSPTILSIRADMIHNVAYQEEIFGPVLVCVQVDTLDDAIALTNKNPYGNGCAIFTQNGACARKFQDEVQVGQIGINVPIPGT